MSKVDTLLEDVLNEKAKDFNNFKGISINELEIYLKESKFQEKLKEKLSNGYKLSKDFNKVDKAYTFMINYSNFFKINNIIKVIIDSKYYVVAVQRKLDNEIKLAYVVIEKNGNKELLNFFSSIL